MKLKIDNEALAEEFFECSRLIGIVAPCNDYHFTWHMNRQLGYNFTLNNSLEIQLKKKNRIYFFAVYQYELPTTCMIHYFYNNQCDGEYLLPEFKHLDFLWLMKGDEIGDEEFNSVIQAIKTLTAVQLVTEMTNEKIKNKQHLIL